MRALYVIYMHLAEKYGEHMAAYYRMTETIRSRLESKISFLIKKNSIKTQLQPFLQWTCVSLPYQRVMFVDADWIAANGTMRRGTNGERV